MTAPAKKRSFIERHLEREPTAIAHREGFTGCNVLVLESTWRRIEEREGSAEAWFTLVFEALRRMLVASIGEKGADAFRTCVVHGARSSWPPFDPRTFYPFFEEVHNGRRGVSSDGQMTAFDVARGSGVEYVILYAWTREDGGVTLRPLLFGFDL